MRLHWESIIANNINPIHKNTGMTSTNFSGPLQTLIMLQYKLNHRQIDGAKTCNRATYGRVEFVFSWVKPIQNVMRSKKQRSIVALTNLFGGI